MTREQRKDQSERMTKWHALNPMTEERRNKLREAAMDYHSTHRKPPADRFWPKVIKGSKEECWPWYKPFKTAYPQFTWGGRKSSVPGHVAAYRLTFGAVPRGVLLCHTCNNKGCCNPYHLYKGTHLTNSRDAIACGTFKFLKPRWGEQHPCSKLTDAQRKMIRSEYYVIPIGQRGAFASIFGISQTHARRIASGKAWHPMQPNIF